MMRYKIKKSDFTGLLSHLLAENYVKEVLSGTEKRNRFAIVPEFTSDPAALANFPLSQLLTYGYTRTDSASNTILHSKKALDTKVAVISRACDVRAMVELDKKLQLEWDNLFIIGLHDMGYISNKTLKKWYKAEAIDESTVVSERLTQTEFILKFADGTMKKEPLSSTFNIASNCSRCVEKSHPLADFLLGTYGLPEDSDDFIITPQSSRAEKIVEALQWSSKQIEGGLAEKYDSIATSIIDACAIKREADLDAFMSNEDRFSLLIKCTACGMCVNACPVCFCAVCNLKAQVKAKTMDKMTFITTRFTHVGDTCVECGRCTTNCPMNIPLDLVFQSLRRTFKKKRGYVAGEDRSQTVMHLDVK
ncbi:MAG: Coenzyme F420 hydrogenase/dehydrogenase, beta subunit C-terminal domain [Promethearchaeota archaeon]